MNTPILFAQAPAPAATTVQAAPAATAAAPAAEAAAPATTATETQPAENAPAPAPQGGGLSMFVPMLLIFALFYFMMIRPQQRKEKERRKMIDELRAGRTVVFAGGFIGKIVEAKEKTFKIEIAGDVVVEVARAAVQSVVEDAPEAK
ncbi:MAG: preprotein translocase subunit YajC [Kiritimatiellia bacterium]